MTAWLVFLVIFGGVLLWLFSSMRRVGPREVAAMVIFGRLVKYCPAGLYFIPRLPACYLIKVSTKQYKVEVRPVEAYTKRGKYREIEYGSEPVKVNPTIYLRFPRGDRLLEVIRAGIPTTEEGLSAHLNNAVQEAVRVAAGQFVWKTVAQQVSKVRDKAQEVFRDPKSPLKAAGFEDDDFRLVIENVEVSPKLKELMSQPNEERLRAEAAKSIAKRRGIEQAQSVIEGYAKSRGISVADAQQEINSDEKERKGFLDYLKDRNLREREAELGALIDIRSNNAGLDVAALLGKLFSHRFSPGNSPQQSEEARGGQDGKTRKRKLRVGGRDVEAEFDKAGEVVSYKDV